MLQNKQAKEEGKLSAGSYAYLFVAMATPQSLY
jgi:hypothetical protein